MAKSYGKSWLTPKNILLYIIVGGLIYGLISYVQMNKTGSMMYQDSASQEQVMDSSLVVPLAAQNDSGQTGTATFTEAGGKTTVVIEVANEPVGASEPAHVHLGACPAPGDVVYPLTNVVDGRSETVLDVDLATIQGQLPLAVNVHKSAAEIKVYMSCGDLY